MGCQAGCDPWRTTIRPPRPHVRTPQASVLALWSCGMVLARSCALTAVSHVWAQGLTRPEQPVRQQRRDGDDEVPRTRGTNRPAWPVATCCPVWLSWVGRGWHGTQLARALEAPALGPRVVGWALSVVDRGCALPGAWVVLPAKTQQAWRRAGRRLVRQLRPAIPRGGQVIVWTDRGVSAPWRLGRMVRLGWPPCVRLHTGGPCRPAGAPGFRPVHRGVPTPGTRWRGRGTALQHAGRQVEGPLWAVWEDGDKAPWVILPDRPPEASAAAWDGRRAGIDPGVHSPTRAGWQGPRTRLPEPERAARLWVAVAVATGWWRRVGGDADETSPASTRLDGTALGPGRPRTRRATRRRLVSGLRQGGVALFVAVRRQAPLREGRLGPEPWPAVPPWAEVTCEPQLALPEAA